MTMYPDLPPIDGGSDAAVDVVEAVLNMSPLCGTCVAAKTGMPAYYVEIALKVLVRIGAIHLDLGPCDACRQPGAFRVGVRGADSEGSPEELKNGPDGRSTGAPIILCVVCGVGISSVAELVLTPPGPAHVTCRLIAEPTD